jgi:cellulose biosynthesis protein BcsQ
LIDSLKIPVMHIAVLDIKPESKVALAGRVKEIIRQAGLRRIEPHEVDLLHAHSYNWSLAQACIIGPGLQSQLREVLSTLKKLFPKGAISAVVDQETYSRLPISTRIELGIPVIAENDLSHLADFILRELNDKPQSQPQKNKGIIGVSHFKGGVGASSLAISLGLYWADSELRVALVDLDDVCPMVTRWSQASEGSRNAVSEYIRKGEIPKNTVHELYAPVSDTNGNLCVIPQSLNLLETYHCKAKAIQDSPSISVYLESLYNELQEQFDCVIVDLGSSWGVSCLTTIKLCSKFLLVSDESEDTSILTLSCVERLIRETNNDSLLGLEHWQLIYNKFQGIIYDEEEIFRKVEKLDIFPPETDMFFIPPAVRSTNRSSNQNIRYSLYDKSELNFKSAISKLAEASVPTPLKPLMKTESKLSAVSDILRKFIHASS